MSVFIFSRQRRVYVVPDIDGSSNPTTAVAAGAPVNANYICVIDDTINPGSNELLRNPCVTGSLSQLAGVRGRGSASWSLTVPVQGSGAAGTKPDCDPLLQALFGAKATVVGATSVSYAIADVLGSMTIYEFDQPSTASHVGVFGAIIGSFSIASTTGLASMTFSGPAIWGIDSNDFSGLNSDEKGQLSSFPTEPTTPVSNGTIVPGFLGSITIDSVGSFSLISWNQSFQTGASIEYVYGKYVPTLFSQDRRTLGWDCRIRDEDSTTASLQTLKTKIRAKTAFNATIVMGATAGNIWTWTVKGLQFGGYSYDHSGNRRELIISGGVASATSATAKDEFALTLT